MPLNFISKLKILLINIFTTEGFSSEFDKIGKEDLNKYGELSLTIIIVVGLLSTIHSIVQQENVSKDVDMILYESPKN